MPSTKRPADADPSPPVSELHFCGMYQPMSVMVDDEDVHHYVPSAAFRLVLSLMWDDASRRSGSVQGELYFKYGLFWDSLQAVDNDEQLFWPVARQTESVVGRVQRRVESRGMRGASEQQSRGSCITLTLHTLRQGVIDASLSSFGDLKLHASEQEQEQVTYALSKFERERGYTLHIDDDTPQLMEGEVTRRFALTDRELADRGKDEEQEEEEETEQDSNELTQIRAWDCTAEYAKYEQDEFALVSAFHQRIVDEFRVVLQAADAEQLSTVSRVLRNVIAEPTELKYRAVNPSKVDATVAGLLKHCAFQDTFMLEKNATFLVLPDNADLLLLSLLVRALDGQAAVLRAQQEMRAQQERQAQLEEPIVLE